MAIINEKENITLTGKTAKSFAEKMKYPNKEVMRKRDTYFKEIEETLSIISNGEGNIILRCR
jgi:hypothetical protein